MLAQTNHQFKQSARENKYDTVFVYEMGKTHTAKIPQGDFKVTTPETPLLSQQVVTNKEISIPYTNL